ncbi:MAG: hypothetical protein H7039_05770 [Bryobacteraceae bacterium]|nr:hypothetical protein [Bryobacteraceae bacterium]
MDLRIPAGWFFLLLGAILIAVSFTGATAPLTDANVNLYAGAAMAIFGGLMLWWSRIQKA